MNNEWFEENIYQQRYVEDLVDQDALSSEEAAFLEGYNAAS